MHNILFKEMKLSSSILSYVFMLFGIMFLLPGYPVLCGAFFSTLGLYKNFEYAREANDITFSVLLPIAKKDVVKGKYCFVCMIESGTLILMTASVILRMTVFENFVAYRTNALMNANMFALGAAFFLFGLFNLIFVGGFFKSAYKTGRPFLIYIIVGFLCIGLFEVMHYIPGFESLNSFGKENIGMQICLLMVGIVLWILLTIVSYRKACVRFEKIDL